MPTFNDPNKTLLFDNAYSSPSLDLSQFPFSFVNWDFERLLATSLSILGKTRSKTSEYHLAGRPSMPSLIF